MSGLHDVLRALQEQHDGLRSAMDECEWLADELDHGREPSRLKQEVVKLRAAFVEHSRFEELALHPFVDTVDAPSIDDVRSDHAEEHRVLSHGLDGTTAELRVTLYRLRAHLAGEERYFRAARMSERSRNSCTVAAPHREACAKPPGQTCARRGMLVAVRRGMEPKHPQVVVAYDFSPNAEAVLARAVALVTRAPFHVLHFVTVIDPHKGAAVVPHHGKVDSDYADRVRDVMVKELGKVLGQTPVASELHFFAHARIGKPSDEILQLAQEIGADLILIGTHGFTGLSRVVMGSVAEHVVREAGCPVLVARPKIYPDVELMKVYEVSRTAPLHSGMRFSYTNNTMVTRPNDWPLY